MEEKRREVEELSLLDQIEDVRQGELRKLCDHAASRKRDAEKKEEEKREKMKEAHFKDMQALKEKQQRMQQIMADAMEAKRVAEAEEAARRKEEVEARKRESQAKLSQVCS